MTYKVVNPFSGRLISVKSRTFNNLERNGLLNVKQNTNGKQENVVYEGTTKEEAQKIKKQLKNTEPNKSLVVRDNNIVKINKRATKNDYRERVVDAAAKVLLRIKDIDVKDPNTSVDRLKNEIYKHIVIGDCEPITVKPLDRNEELNILKSNRQLSQRKINKKHKEDNSSDSENYQKYVPNVKQRKFKVKDITDYEISESDN